MATAKRPEEKRQALGPLGQIPTVTALQIALAYCWVTLVGAELLASDQGLGYLITMGRSLGRTDIVVLGMFGVGIAGAIIGVVIDKIEARLLAGIRR